MQRGFTLYFQRALTFLFLIGLTSLSACQRDLSPQSSCNFLQNRDQQRVSWKNGLPIEVSIHSSVPQSAYESIEAAIAVYDDIFGQKTFLIREYGSTGPLAPSRDGKSVIYWMPEWESDRFLEQGRTTVYWSGHTIYEADIRINASGNFQFHFHSSAPIYGVDLKSLFVHELGHALGLDHNDLAGSIMNTHLGERTSRTELSGADIDNLRCEYGLSG